MERRKEHDEGDEKYESHSIYIDMLKSFDIKTEDPEDTYYD